METFLLVVGLFFIAALCIAASFSLRPVAAAPVQAPVPPASFRMPRSAYEAHALLSDSQFELFSAAVIVGLGQGYTFVMHMGGSGDRGVDTVVQNVALRHVYVQSKRYVSTNKVEPYEVRGFVGAISMGSAVYGYFVTTSTLTTQAHQEATGSRRVRVIDGPALDRLLRTRFREITLAYQDVLHAVQ